MRLLEPVGRRRSRVRNTFPRYQQKYVTRRRYQNDRFCHIGTSTRAIPMAGRLITTYVRVRFRSIHDGRLQRDAVLPVGPQLSRSDSYAETFKSNITTIIHLFRKRFHEYTLLLQYSAAVEFKCTPCNHYMLSSRHQI